jgi:ComF family protein
MPPFCPLCGRPQSSGILCPGCTGWQASIDGIRSPFRFEKTVRQAVYQLKYRNLRILAEPLAGLMYGYLSGNPVPGEVLVPVPLHRKRLRERGYNQSGLLAKWLGKFTGLPVVDDCLVRERLASPQARSSGVDERRNNVAGAFACRDDRLRDKEVLLVDDVCTSGATLDACAEALKESGAASVWGLTLAREI